MKKLEIDPRAKALIFDLDGTLVDTMPLHYRAWSCICKQHGKDYPEDLFYQLAGMPSFKIVKELNRQLNLNMDPHVTFKEKDELFLSLIHEMTIIEPVVQLVYDNADTMQIAVGTGARTPTTRLILEKMNLLKYFPVIVTSDDVSAHKPEPHTFLKCAELMNVEPEYCQVFEDGEKGLEAAERAGMIATDVRPFLLTKS